MIIIYSTKSKNNTGKRAKNGKKQYTENFNENKTIAFRIIYVHVSRIVRSGVFIIIIIIIVGRCRCRRDVYVVFTTILTTQIYRWKYRRRAWVRVFKVFIFFFALQWVLPLPLLHNIVFAPLRSCRGGYVRLYNICFARNTITCAGAILLVVLYIIIIISWVYVFVVLTAWYAREPSSRNLIIICTHLVDIVNRV